MRLSTLATALQTQRKTTIFLVDWHIFAKCSPQHTLMECISLYIHLIILTIARYMLGCPHNSNRPYSKSRTGIMMLAIGRQIHSSQKRTSGLPKHGNGRIMTSRARNPISATTSACSDTQATSCGTSPDYPNGSTFITHGQSPGNMALPSSRKGVHTLTSRYVKGGILFVIADDVEWQFPQRLGAEAGWSKGRRQGAKSCVELGTAAMEWNVAFDKCTYTIPTLNSKASQ